MNKTKCQENLLCNTKEMKSSPFGGDSDLGEDTGLFFWLVEKDSAFLERDENLAVLSPSPGSSTPKLAIFHFCLMGSISRNEDGSEAPGREELSFQLAP